MNCGNCKQDLNTKNSSEKEGLLFYCICDNCKIVNKVEIDLNENKLVSSIADDNELEKVKELFDRKRKKELAKEEYIQIAEANELNNALAKEYMIEDFMY